MRDVETLLAGFGFVPDRISGSHHLFVYRHGGVYHSISIPLHGRKVKKAYIQRVAELLDELFPLAEDTNEGEADEQES